jgi:hypothetical protein
MLRDKISLLILIFFIHVRKGFGTDGNAEIIPETSQSVTSKTEKQSDLISIVSTPSLEASLNVCKNENQELLMRLERLESVFNVSQFNPDLDDVSLMELMYISLKEKFVKSIPRTDGQCHFDFITGKCSSPCTCEFKPRFGDYTPSRMCRLIPNDRIDSTCDHERKDAPWMIVSAKFIKNSVGSALTSAMRRLQEKAPPTDPECRFSLPVMDCVPSTRCTLEYQFGDYNPHRSCRYRSKTDQIENKGADLPPTNYNRELVGIS